MQQLFLTVDCMCVWHRAPMCIVVQFLSSMTLRNTHTRKSVFASLLELHIIYIHFWTTTLTVESDHLTCSTLAFLQNSGTFAQEVYTKGEKVWVGDFFWAPTLVCATTGSSEARFALSPGSKLIQYVQSSDDKMYLQTGMKSNRLRPQPLPTPPS